MRFHSLWTRWWVAASDGRVWPPRLPRFSPELSPFSLGHPFPFCPPRGNPGLTNIYLLLIFYELQPPRVGLGKVKGEEEER
jgi:hypothetical protein